MDILVQKNIPVPMRDGVTLVADVYRPHVDVPLPVLLQRTPYNKENAAGADVLRMAGAGYVVVLQDTRGRFASGGVFDPFVHEADDGAETVGWAGRQAWSNGTVGMFGRSYVGATQWLAATAAPHALQAIAPTVTAADYYEGWTYAGGAFQLGFCLSWTLWSLALPELQRRVDSGDAEPADLARHIDAIDALPELYRILPLDAVVSNRLAPYYATWLAHPHRDGHWRRIAPREQYERITVPALNIGGWYDIFIAGTLANYRGMRQRGGSEAARSGQRLLVGPWAHGAYAGMFPDRLYGWEAHADVADLTGIQLRWFDRRLKGIDNGVDRERPVRLFLMGADTWHDEDDWPLPGTDYQTWYLHSGGRANTAAGDGSLSCDLPAGEPEDVYLYDPRDPVPTAGGATYLPGIWVATNAGPGNQRAVETRRDVLCYTSTPLATSLEVTGPIELVLHASSSALDTDFTGKLVAVAPNGKAELLTDGILRARFRDSLAAPALLQPGTPYELRLDLGATAYRFAPGYRLRLEVSSSNFPRFDRNLNTGEALAGGIALTQAVNRIYHDRLRPSHLILPVIDRA